MKKLSPTLVLLGTVSFLTDVSGEMIFPLLPIFITQTLGAQTFAMGAIEGAAEFSASFLKFFSGFWSDKSGSRKKYILVGYGLTSVSRVLLPFVQSWIPLMGVRMLDRTGKGIRGAPRDSVIADITDSQHLGFAYGFHQAMDHAGAVAGPLLALFLWQVLHLEIRTIFIVAAGPTIIAVGLLFFLKQKKAPDIQKNKISLRSGFRALSPTYKKFLLALFIFLLGSSSDSFLLLYLHKLGISVGGMALLWAVLHVVKAVSNQTLGILADKIGSQKSLKIGWIYYALIYLGFAFCQSKSEAITLFLIYGLYYGFVEPSEKAFISKISDPAYKGFSFGFFHLTSGVAGLFASIIFGFLVDRYSFSTAFLAGAGFSLMGFLMWLMMPVHDTQRKNSPQDHKNLTQQGF